MEVTSVLARGSSLCTPVVLLMLLSNSTRPSCTGRTSRKPGWQPWRFRRRKLKLPFPLSLLVDAHGRRQNPKIGSPTKMIGLSVSVVYHSTRMTANFRASWRILEALLVQSSSLSHTKCGPPTNCYSRFRNRPTQLRTLRSGHPWFIESQKQPTRQMHLITDQVVCSHQSAGTGQGCICRNTVVVST